MKANELRIGNKVNWKDGGVVEIEPSDFRELDVNEDYFDFASGIPLTEEWLVRFGFEKKLGLMCWEKEGIEIVYETVAKFYRFYPRTNKIQYVHQLQNLYFALTNTELIWNGEK